MDAIMDARCPYPFQKQETQMCNEMNRHYKQRYHVRYSLKYPVQRVKCEPWKPEKRYVPTLEIDSCNILEFEVKIQKTPRQVGLKETSWEFDLPANGESVFCLL